MEPNHPEYSTNTPSEQPIKKVESEYCETMNNAATTPPTRLPPRHNWAVLKKGVFSFSETESKLKPNNSQQHTPLWEGEASPTLSESLMKLDKFSHGDCNDSGFFQAAVAPKCSTAARQVSRLNYRSQMDSDIFGLHDHASQRPGKRQRSAAEIFDREHNTHLPLHSKPVKLQYNITQMA